MFDTEGGFIGEVLGPRILTYPGKMAINGEDLLVADRPANAVFIYNTVDETCRQWNHTFEAPGFIGRDPQGNVWVGRYTIEPNSDGAAFQVFTSKYEFLRTVSFHETHQPTCITFAAGHILIGDQDARNVFIFSAEGALRNRLREEPYDAPVWAVQTDGTGHIHVGVGPVVDLLWSAKQNRLYYIDFDTSSVRYSSTGVVLSGR
jgi:hypothetical protein